MIHQPEIWDVIKKQLVKGKWMSLEEIYETVEQHLSLDREDFEPQSPSSDFPKWKRNVRNVLQYRKKTGKITWSGQGTYKI